MPTPNISQPAPPTPEVPAEVIATAIAEIAEAMKKLSSTRLQREAIVALIHDTSGIAKKTIRIVLNNLQCLETDWLKPKKG